MITNDFARLILYKSREIQKEVNEIYLPPAEGIPPKTERVLAFSIVKGTRKYIEKVTKQANGCYEHGCYDACAVMMRRLVETVIIEAFEHHGIADKIKDRQGNFLPLKDLIQASLNEHKWNLGRKAKSSLTKLKDVGNRSAHDRRYNAHRPDIDQVIPEFRAVVQEFISLAGLK